MTDTLGLILVGAGMSRRMGQIDKVWAPLGDHPIVWHSMARLAPHAARVVLVVRAEHLARGRACATEFGHISVVPGGAERQQSVFRGLAELNSVDLVAVHDVARPFAKSEMLVLGIAALRENDGAVPVVPVNDTIKEVDGNRVRATLNRERLRAVQTPQVFRAHALLHAHELAHSNHTVATDDAQLLEAAGYRVGTFEGDPSNFKITTPADLLRARLVLDASRQL